MVKKLKLKNGEISLVDDDDYDFLMQWRWCLSSKGYAQRCTTDGKTFYIHRVVNKTPKGVHTDHINGERLDNRKINLRCATTSQNAINMSKSWGSSKYKGVAWLKNSNKWCAQIQFNKKLKWLGSFHKEEDAALAYNKKAIELFGEFAYLNEVPK